MKKHVLNLFAAKKIIIDDQHILNDLIMDKIGGDFEFQLSTLENDESYFDAKVTFNYFHGQFIDANLYELIYHDGESGKEFDLSCDLEIDIAFDDFLYNNYSF